MTIKPIIFNDVEKELVRVFKLLLTQKGETDFIVATQKRQDTANTQYIFRSEASEIINRVFKAEDCALTIYLKIEPTMNEAYAESKRVGLLAEALLPVLSNLSTFISYVENVDVMINDFDDVTQIYMCFITFTVYHKGSNLSLSAP